MCLHNLLNFSLFFNIPHQIFHIPVNNKKTAKILHNPSTFPKQLKTAKKPLPS